MKPMNRKKSKIKTTVSRTETKSLTSTLESNIRSRQLANEVVEMGIQYCKEEKLKAEQAKRFWQLIIQTASALIGNEVECSRCKQLQAQATEKVLQPTSSSSKPRTLYDDDLMPFGKYKGQPLGNVPEEYLDWLRDNWTGSTESNLYQYLTADSLELA